MCVCLGMLEAMCAWKMCVCERCCVCFCVLVCVCACLRRCVHGVLDTFLEEEEGFRLGQVVNLWMCVCFLCGHALRQ